MNGLQELLLWTFSSLVWLTGRVVMMVLLAGLKTQLIIITLPFIATI